MTTTTTTTTTTSALSRSSRSSSPETKTTPYVAGDAELARGLDSELNPRPQSSASSSSSTQTVASMTASTVQQAAHQNTAESKMELESKAGQEEGGQA